VRKGHCGNCGYLVEYHETGSRCPGLKTKQWQERDPIDGALWPELLARDVAARTRALEKAKQPYIPVTMPEPVIPARPPYGPHEFAGYRGRQAVGLGRRAAAACMDVAPYFWKSGLGVEGCAVKGFRRDTFAFVATWERKIGASWGFDVAYWWRPGGKPAVQVGYIELLELL
jgi:hypothetical protein